MKNNNISFQWLKSATQIKTDKGFNQEYYKEIGTIFRDHMDKYVPWDPHNTTNYHLATMVQIRPLKDGANVVYSMKYARPNYYKEFHRPSEHSPLATGFWDKYCWELEGDEMMDEIKKARRRYCNE